MRKLYIFAVAILVTGVTNAQILQDDFESYTLGDMATQSPWWSVYSGTPRPIEDLQVVNDFASSGTQSGYIGGNLDQDALLLLGNLTTGDYTLTFKMRISQGSTGYFHVEGDGVHNSGDIYFNQSETSPGQGIDVTFGEPFTYPEDEFFIVQFYFDVDASTYTMHVDGTQVNANPVPFQADAVLGGMNFYSVSLNNEYWIDDVVFENGYQILNNLEVAVETIKVYPNPVKNTLFLSTVKSIDQISVYDIMGKKVLEVQPHMISPNVDLSTLDRGTYLIKISAENNATKMVKIVK